jgi:hypothetical protein
MERPIEVANDPNDDREVEGILGADALRVLGRVEAG